MLQYYCWKTKQMANFLYNIFKNRNKSKNDKFYKHDVHKIQEGTKYPETGLWHLTDFHKRVISLSRGALSLKIKMFCNSIVLFHWKKTNNFFHLKVVFIKKTSKCLASTAWLFKRFPKGIIEKKSIVFI